MCMYVSQLPMIEQEEIKEFLKNTYGIGEEDLERAMNSKISDIADLLLNEDNSYYKEYDRIDPLDKSITRISPYDVYSVSELGL